MSYQRKARTIFGEPENDLEWDNRRRCHYGESQDPQELFDAGDYHAATEALNDQALLDETSKVNQLDQWASQLLERGNYKDSHELFDKFVPASLELLGERTLSGDIAEDRVYSAVNFIFSLHQMGFFDLAGTYEDQLIKSVLSSDMPMQNFVEAIRHRKLVSSRAQILFEALTERLHSQLEQGKATYDDQRDKNLDEDPNAELQMWEQEQPAEPESNENIGTDI